MSELVEIRTGATVSDAVSRLAASVGDATLSLPVGRKIAEGEWVRFAVMLDDGTRVLEGIGRCDGSLPRGNPIGHYDVTLSELQFDERNEIMFERVCIAREAAQKGDDTGAIKLDAKTLSAIEDTASAPDERVSAEPARKRSVPPPMSGAKSASARKSAPPARASAPAPSPNDTKPDLARPAQRPRSPSIRPAPIRDEDCRLDVEPALVGRARSLAPRLPRRLLDREDRPGKPEEAVLRAAIRIGLSALAAIADDDDTR